MAPRRTTAKTADEVREAREAKLSELSERLEGAVGRLVSGDDWSAAVRFAARFRSRSANTLLGTSPMAYLRWMRVERMARLLVSTDLSVAEATRSVGWRNQFHASQCFHTAYGISPTEYRRQHATPPRLTA